jgi:hypothetical protein
VAGAAGAALVPVPLVAGFLLWFLCFFTPDFELLVEEGVVDWLLSAGFAGVCAANVKGIRARPSTVAIIVFFIFDLSFGLYLARQFHLAAGPVFKR